MDETHENILIDKYETIVVFGFIFPAFILLFMSYGYITAIIDSFALTTILISVTISILTFIAVGIASFRKYHHWPKQRKYYSTLLYSLIAMPFFGVTFMVVTNCFLDTSKPIIRNTVIVDKSEYHSTRKGQRRNFYYVYVRSWRPDMDKIKISVNSRDFNDTDQDVNVTVKTKKGFWDLEYIVENE